MLSKARGATKRALRRRTGTAALQEPWQASLHSLVPICECSFRGGLTDQGLNLKALDDGKVIALAVKIDHARCITYSQ